MNFSVTITNESGIIASREFVNFADTADYFESFPMVAGQTAVIRRLSNDAVLAIFVEESTRYSVAA